MVDERRVGKEQVRVIIAVRVSSEDQKLRGYGHASQLERLPELVAAQGWELAKRPDGRPAIYDEGDASTTAAKGNDYSLDTRPVMQELIAELPTVLPTYLVCRGADRLHRSRLEWEMLCFTLVQAGVTGIAQFPQLSGGPSIQRLDSVHDQTLGAMQAAFAELQKAELKTNLMTGRRARAHRGLPNGGRVPYGYRRPGPKLPFVVVPEEAQVYEQLVTRTIDGWGPAKIANELTKQGTPTRNGAAGWTATTVRRVMASRAQLGMVRTWDGWVPGLNMEPIVTQERWELAQAMLATRKRDNGGTNTKRNVLAGLLRCSACGKTLKAYTNRPLRKTKGAGEGERYAYKHYTCKVYNSGCSAGHSISERRALKELAAHVDQRLASTEHWVSVKQEQPDIGNLEDNIEALAKQHARASGAVKTAYEGYLNADEDLKQIAATTLNERRKRLADLAAELDQARRAYAAAQTVKPEEVLDLEELKGLLEEWQTFDADDKRELLAHLIERAVVLPAGRSSRLEVVWRHV